MTRCRVLPVQKLGLTLSLYFLKPTYSTSFSHFIAMKAHGLRKSGSSYLLYFFGPNYKKSVTDGNLIKFDRP